VLISPNRSTQLYTGYTQARSEADQTWGKAFESRLGRKVYELLQTKQDGDCIVGDEEYKRLSRRCLRIKYHGLNPGGGRDFRHLSRPALGPTQPPVQWVPGLSRR
jgi:hypothetical protein